MSVNGRIKAKSQIAAETDFKWNLLIRQLPRHIGGLDSAHTVSNPLEPKHLNRLNNRLGGAVFACVCCRLETFAAGDVERFSKITD